MDKPKTFKSLSIIALLVFATTVTMVLYSALGNTHVASPKWNDGAMTVITSGEKVLTPVKELGTAEVMQVAEAALRWQMMIFHVLAGILCLLFISVAREFFIPDLKKREKNTNQQKP